MVPLAWLLFSLGLSPLVYGGNGVNNSTVKNGGQVHQVTDGNITIINNYNYPVPAKEASKKTTKEEPKKTTEEWTKIDRYLVKGGLVKDIKTGLMWMRCSLGQEWNGSTCQGEATEYTWIKVANRMFDYAGYKEWRLPTREELKTLVYCSSGEFTDLGDCYGKYTTPTVKTEVFLNTPSNAFLSSSSFNGSGIYSWIVYFDYRNSLDFDFRDNNGNYKGRTSGVVRLVRSGQ